MRRYLIHFILDFQFKILSNTRGIRQFDTWSNERYGSLQHRVNIFLSQLKAIRHF